MNYKAGQAGIQTPVTGDQALAGLKQQQDFINALASQNGIQNQNNVYGQLSNVANGTGPNPAQAMLAQATGQNVANQAALMAGQRGASANAGLMARQAANQGANLQQQAAGQGATMQANQALGALGQMGGIAGQQIGNQAGAIQNYNQNLLGSLAGQNQAQVGSMASQNSANATVANTVAGQQGNMAGNLMGGAGMGMMLAGGGVIPHYVQGGVAVPPTNEPVNDTSFVSKFLSGSNAELNQTDPLSKGSNQFGKGVGNRIGGMFKAGPAEGTMAGGPMDAVAPAMDTGMAPMMAIAAHGGKVPALVSPGEGYLPPDKAKAAAQGSVNAYKAAEKIPGKPKVGGAVDSYQNDTVKKTLDEGGVILPRSVMESKNPEKKAAEFVAAVLAKSGKSIGSAMPKKKK